MTSELKNLNRDVALYAEYVQLMREFAPEIWCNSKLSEKYLMKA